MVQWTCHSVLPLIRLKREKIRLPFNMLLRIKVEQKQHG